MQDRYANCAAIMAEVSANNQGISELGSEQGFDDRRVCRQRRRQVQITGDDGRCGSAGQCLRHRAQPRAGETIRLPDGEYSIEFERGPESIAETREVTVGEGARELSWKVRRWIDP